MESFLAGEQPPAGKKLIFESQALASMQDVFCPHCDGVVELPALYRGSFICPLCEEEFVYEGKHSSRATTFHSGASGPRSKVLGGVGVLVGLLLLAMPVVGMYLLIGGAFHAYNVSTWPVEEVEVLETSYDSYWVPEDGEYHEVTITFSHEDTSRSVEMYCGSETHAEYYMEEHPVGTFIDMRVNPERTDPMYEVDGGCDPWTKEDTILYAGCFGLIIVLAGIAKLVDVVRSKRSDGST